MWNVCRDKNDKTDAHNSVKSHLIAIVPLNGSYKLSINFF